jgi:ATP synthase protein I
VEPRDPSNRNRLLEPAKQLQAGFQNAGPVAAAGYTLIGAILLLGGAGYAADRWLGTDPWLLIIGLFAGITVGFYELARIVWRKTR